MAIQFVGTMTTTTLGATSGNTTIALDADLLDGIAAAVSASDLVIAVYGSASAADRTLSITDGTNPYTLIGSELYANDDFDTNLRVAYKFMGGTPDTTTTFGPTGDAADAGAMAVYVFRGVDTGTPLDGVAVVTNTQTGTGQPDPPSITPTSAGAFIVVVGAAAHSSGATTWSGPFGLAGFVSDARGDNNDITIGIGHKNDWTSGAFNPDAWTDGPSADATFSCASLCFVLRPAGGASVKLKAMHHYKLLAGM